MGEPVDGTLFYGYCWDKEIDLGDDETVFETSALLREVAAQTDIGWYGVDNHAPTYLYIAASERCGPQFHPKAIDLDRLFLDAAANKNWWKAMLDTHLETVGVQPPEGDNQPGWWLVSRYCS